jgi:hypothetical protein
MLLFSWLVLIYIYIYSYTLLISTLSGPTHVLVVRGLDDNADEEMLRYEFSKHAPIKVQNAIKFNWFY